MSWTPTVGAVPTASQPSDTWWHSRNPTSRMQTDDDMQAVHRLNEAYQQITTELSKVIVGQKQVIEELLVAMFARGHCLLVGVPGLAKTLMIRTVADALALQVQPHSVHARPDAVGHHRHGGHPGRPGDRRARVPLRARADLRQRDPGRRDQPHAAQDAGRAARSDAGAPGHGRRPAAPLAGAVLRAGDAEPDRAGRDLSAARGAARPVHVPRLGRLSRRPTRSWRSSSGRRPTSR